MKQIALRGKAGKGLFALVDDDDYKYLNQFKWYVQKQKAINYARRNLPVNAEGKTLQVKMHRELLNLKNSKILGEHKNHNGLDNQRHNIRKSSVSENAKNKRCKKCSKSKYLGVGLLTCKRRGKLYKYWVSHILIKGKDKHIGCFPHTKEGEMSAAKRYDSYAKKVHKEFANPNFL